MSTVHSQRTLATSQKLAQPLYHSWTSLKHIVPPLQHRVQPSQLSSHMRQTAPLRPRSSQFHSTRHVQRYSHSLCRNTSIARITSSTAIATSPTVVLHRSSSSRSLAAAAAAAGKRASIIPGSGTGAVVSHANLGLAQPLQSPTKTLASHSKTHSRLVSIASHLKHSNPQIAPTTTTASSTQPFSTFSSSSSPLPSQPTEPTDIMAYSVRKIAAANTLEHRVYLEKDGQLISPFHDIPLYANAEKTILNMVVEVPRWTNAKMEISKEERLNPILQDTKKGKLRFVRNCFPHKGYLWNYGAFPQTWEDPNVTHPETKANGDNDPLDVCEIGELVAKPGDVKQVKVLGVMALLDEGETDWKIMVIDVKDPLAPKLNDIEDVERHLPGLLRASNEWFRIYKIPDGKPENQFAFSGECKNKKYAMDVVRECAEAWERLITGKTNKDQISLTNTTISESPDKVSASSINIPAGSNELPAPIDPSIDKWFFISGAPTA